MRFLTFILLQFMLMPSMALADSTLLYRVSAFNCKHGFGERISTGFQLREGEMIITALHGVLGCNFIEVQKFDGLEATSTTKEFKIEKVDFDNDVAFLSDGRSSLPILPEAAQITDNQRLRVVGFPHAIGTPDTIYLSSGTPAFRKLRTLMNPEMAKSFSKVQSPSLQSIVLRLDGNAQIGHSGAPVIDDDGSIVATLIGGFGKGEFGTSWAVPLSEIKAIEPTAAQLDTVANERHRFSVRFDINLGEIPDVLIPDVADISRRSEESEYYSSKDIGNVKIGMLLSDARQILLTRNSNCHEIDGLALERNFWRRHSSKKPDPVFKTPMAFECVEEGISYELFLIYPDVYETNKRVFSVLRKIQIIGASEKDLLDIVDSYYGKAWGDRDFWLNARVFWPTRQYQMIPNYEKTHSGCFLYTWRAFKTSYLGFDYYPFSEESDDYEWFLRRSYAQLLSEEITQDCGVILNGVLHHPDQRSGSRNSSITLLLVDTSRVREYKEHSMKLQEKSDAERSNVVRDRIKF